MAIRAPAPPAWDRNVFVRVEQIAATLPQADADLLRGQIKSPHDAIDDGAAQYLAAQDSIRETLRQDPVQARRHARRHGQYPRRAAEFRQVIQGVFADVGGRKCRHSRPPRFGRLAAPGRK